jgi:hypothetical protein
MQDAQHAPKSSYVYVSVETRSPKVKAFGELSARPYNPCALARRKLTKGHQAPMQQ